MGSYVTRTHAAGVSGLRTGPFGRWADGVTAMREDCAAFARYWQAHNDQVLAMNGPLWVVLGDSTAQGLGAPSPDRGYVGQVLTELRERTHLPWRVLNLSVSGALTRDVISAQLPRLPAHADLVTCGIGINDILYTSPGKLFADLRALIAAVPDQTVLLDLPLPAGCWGLLGRASVPYVTRINRTIRQAADARSLPVAEVSAHFLPPGPASSPPTASTPARPATATGPARCSPPWQTPRSVRPKDLSPERTCCLPCRRRAPLPAGRWEITPGPASLSRAFRTSGRRHFRRSHRSTAATSPTGRSGAGRAGF